MEKSHVDKLSKNREYVLLKGINEAFSQLLHHEDETTALFEAFKVICEIFGCDGVYLLHYLSYTEEKLSTQVYFAMRQDGKEWKILPKSRMDFPLEDEQVRTGTFNFIKEDDTIIAHRQNAPEQFNSILKAMEIESHFVHKIMINKELWGSISFVSKTFQNQWVKPPIKTLIPFINTLANFLAHKQAENLQLQQKHLSETITSTIPDWILLVDVNNQKFTYNNISYPLIGFSQEEVPDLFIFLMNRLHPEDKKTTYAFFERLANASDGEIVEKRFRLQHKEGYWLHFQERAKVFSRLPNGNMSEYLGIVQDITDNVKAQYKLEESEQRYRNFISHSFDGIYYMRFEKPIPLNLTIDQQVDMYYQYGYIEECNVSFARMYGYEDTSILIGLRVIDVHGGEYFEYNRKSTYDFIKSNYQVANSETVEHDINGKEIYLLNHAIGDIRDGHCFGVWGTQQDITERRKAERDLIESENILRAMMNAIPDLKFRMTKEGFYKGYFESEYENISPISSASRFIGKHLKDALPPDLAEDHLILIRNAIRDKKIQTNEYSFISPSGEVRYRESRVAPINDNEVVAVVRDVTDRKKAEQELKESQELLKAIVNALPDLKFRINKDFIFLDYYESENENEPTLIPPSAFLGKRLDEVLPDSITKSGMKAIEMALLYKNIQTFEYFLPINGKMHYYEGRVSPMSEGEVILAVRNISDQRQTQMELREKLRELDEKNKELTAYIESNSQLENFAYIASHDLREPVRTIHSFAQLIQKNYNSILDEKGMNYLQFIINGAENMNFLIEDLLTYSRVSSEEIVFESIELPKLVHDVIKNLTSFILENEADIYLSFMPDNIIANRIRIKQLFQNLIVNAIKFHREGLSPKIHISGVDHDEYWLFEMKDNGIGIPPEMQDKIFQLFKKIHRHKQYPGTGIGLALCKRIIEQHGGEIWVESTVGKGSSFYFTIKKSLG
ncbi:MAG: PAS domain S-box protein [Saprospiraceae bacterium]|nr:PAS domain S-box protein [Saprospiraceae bacterium]